MGGTGEAGRVAGTGVGWPGSGASPVPDPASATGGSAARAPVRLRVVWGDLCQVEADVHVVGHYQGVMPTSAEAALDAAISGGGSSRRIIAEHTRREWFLGDFGHVNYFPSSDGVVRLAATAGMGRPGTFSETRCARLAENLLIELCSLGSARRVATVCIGSGAGNLSLDQSTRALATGFGAALRSTRMTSPCTHIEVVEFDRLRAERMLASLRVAVTGLEDQLALEDALGVGKDGGLSTASASVYALGAFAASATTGGDVAAALQTCLERVGDPQVASLVMERLRGASQPALIEAADITLRQTRDQPQLAPVRISVLEGTGGTTMRVAAITGTATVPERQIEADPKLIDEIVRRMSPPPAEDMTWLAELMSRMVLPADLQALVTTGAPLVFEVDRRTAEIHWELVADLVRSSSSEDGATPLVLQTSVSRQLRTAHSRVAALDVQRSRELNVLLIGDPGDGRLALPGARREAEALRATLVKLGVKVKALIGPPPASGAEPTPVPEGAEETLPATRLDVLGELLSGQYEIVHYCGHGSFDPDDQRRAGWVFADGLLTARELAQLGTPPRLILANACFTSSLATGAATASAREAQLAPSLADEFFRAGVVNYVGAAWAVSDIDATLFASTFYEQLLGTSRATVGEAVTRARLAVWDANQEWTPGQPGTTWVAYQHYGDPTDRVLTEGRTPTASDQPPDAVSA